MAGDLWALYRFSVDDIKSPAMMRVACQLIQRVNVEPFSMARAEIAHMPSLYGWTPEAEALASVYELIEAFMSMFANKRAKIAPYPNRPNVERPKPLSMGEAAARLASFAAS